jgi:hypothetical protein
MFNLQDSILECVGSVEGASGVNRQFGFTVTFEDSGVRAFPSSSFVFTLNTRLLGVMFVLYFTTLTSESPFSATPLRKFTSSAADCQYLHIYIDI